MPAWTQYILGAAALLIAFGVLWTKGIRPLARFIATAEKMIPLMVNLNQALGATPQAFNVLDEIVAQFRTDSGSSLKDQVNRLEIAAERQEANAEHLKVGVASQKELAEDDRKQLRSLLVELGINAQAMRDLGDAVEIIKKNAASVADDLAAAHKRADEVSNQPHGAAADAAAQQTVKEKEQQPDGGTQEQETGN